MLSIQEIKLMIEKLERLEKEEWQQFIQEFKNKLQSLALTVDAYNEDQVTQLDKTRDWYQRDLDWRHERDELLNNDLLIKNISSKIGQFAKMGNTLQNCLEIGPGYGKFIQCLLSWRIIYLVDILPNVFSKIKKKLNPKHHQFLKFYTGLSDIPTNSCSFIFSWDTFTFFTQEHIAQYLKEINRTILPGGYGFIHYADCNYDEDLHEAKRGYWNFNTRERMTQMLKDAGFETVETSQFCSRANYVIFKKPGNQNVVLYKITEIPVEK